MRRFDIGILGRVFRRVLGGWRCGGEGVEFLIQLIFKLIDGFGEVLLHDEWIGINNIAHCLYFIHESFSYGCVHKADGCLCQGLCFQCSLGVG